MALIRRDVYLKNLTALGFKSFADKTSLDFQPGMTAIVGPNGRGKSNVSDAVRWVLGEQSAKALRGSGMADVIFNGTDKRKALGMAEVSLTVGGIDKDQLKAAGVDLPYDEVTVTRRIFRDGASEFFINKVSCRLKDIQQLFMGTGMGRASYGIMAQGNITQLISSKPDDRRVVFEEAAGITRFKSQKKEALRKLEVEGMKGLVLDLRHNPGGLLEQAVRVSEKFLAKGQLIVTTEGRRENEKRESSGRAARPDLPMVVLVNRFSASASEIVAGCLKDNDRAEVVGEKTFGKGSVQRIVPINGQHGAALRLTTSKYYTPSHEVIHGKGIRPHHEVKLSHEEEELLFLQRTPGGLKMVPENRRETVEKFTDPQLAKAMELLTGEKQLQAKAKPEKEEKPAEKPEPKEAPKKDSKPEKKPEPKPEAKDEPADKPE